MNMHPVRFKCSAIESIFQSQVNFVALNLWYGFQGDRISNSSVKWLKFNR